MNPIFIDPNRDKVSSLMAFSTLGSWSTLLTAGIPKMMAHAYPILEQIGLQMGRCSAIGFAASTVSAAISVFWYVNRIPDNEALLEKMTTRVGIQIIPCMITTVVVCEDMFSFYTMLTAAFIGSGAFGKLLVSLVERDVKALKLSRG